MARIGRSYPVAAHRPYIGPVAAAAANYSGAGTLTAVAHSPLQGASRLAVAALHSLRRRRSRAAAL
jgi:hypothetical protein